MIRILIVDDEKIERNGIKFLLKQLHMEAQIREAVNGVKALEALEEEPADILLTDIKMPFMDGLTLAENVVEKYPQTKMVIFSGYGEFEYARKAMKSGVNSYILKPVDPEEFRSTMEKVLQEIEGERLEDERKEKNRNFVKEHVILSLLNGAAPEDLAKSLGDMGSLEDVQDFQNMMLLEFDREFFGRTGLDFLENLREEMNEPFLYLNMNPQQGIILLERSIEIEARREMAQKLQDTIEKKYGDRCYIAVSREFEHPVRLAEEMERAIREHPIEKREDNGFYFLQDIFQVLDNNREIVSALVGPYGDMRFIQKVEVILARNSRKVLEQMFPEKSDQMDYFYAYCLNGCLGFVKTWLADKKSCTPEFAADFIYRMVVSSMRAFCETREEV